jgi:hypothetical protein
MRPDQANTAYLVLGPERSGTRLLTKLLMQAGCTGSNLHKQPLDREIPPDAGPLVWRRSFPHGKEWPVVSDLVQALARAGYHDVVALVMVRDWTATADALVRAKRAATTVEAIDYIRRGVDLLALGLHQAALRRYELVTYEALVLHQREVLAGLLGRLGLAAGQVTLQVRDENAKHYRKGDKGDE